MSDISREACDEVIEYLEIMEGLPDEAAFVLALRAALDAPETIWAKPSYEEWLIGGWDDHGKAGGIKYRRADLTVRVKPLVWNESKAPVAVACVGVYLMSHDFDGWYWILTQQGQIVGMATKPDLELTTAQAAAQADHDARIRAALEE